MTGLEHTWLARVAACKPLPRLVAEEVFGLDKTLPLWLPPGSPLMVARRVAPIAGAAKAGYSVKTEGGIALVAATAKTILNAVAPAQFGVDLQGFWVGFDGVTASAVPVLVEVCRSTQAGVGTSTAKTVNQEYGPTITAGFTGAGAYTAEPTVLTALEEFLLTPNGGLVAYDWQFGKTLDTAVSQAIAIRCTAPAAVNVRATERFERT